MLTYLYGLVLGRNAHLVPAHITGVGGAVVRVVECDRVGALVSTVVAKPRSGSLDDIRAHDHVLGAVLHHGASVTSVRFGQSFHDDDAMRGYVSKLESSISALLEQQDGCVEMHLLLVVQPSMWDFLSPAPAEERTRDQRGTPGPGRAYLEKLKAERTGEDPSGYSLKHRLGDVVRAERVESMADGHFHRFAHLIRSEDEARYREAVARHELLRGAPVEGPMAFYSFAGSHE